MPNKARIVCVDDEQEMINALKRILRGNYDIITFTDPLLALNSIKEIGNTVDVIISDIRMPDLNGYQFIQKIKDIFPDIQCIIHTGMGIDDNSIIEAINKRLIFRYLEKPCSLEDILDAVNSAIEVKSHNTEIKNNSIFNIQNLDAISEKDKILKLAEIGFHSSRFLHDINNDISSICNLSYFLKKSNLKVDNYNHIYDLIDVATNNIIDILNDLNYFINKNKLLISPTKTNIFSYISNLLPELISIFNDKTKIKIDIPKDFTLSLDQSKFKRVIKNIAKNSAESIYNKEGSFIISLDEDNKEIIFSDNGFQSPEYDTENFFDSFNSSKKMGMGLGLLNVREIVHLHNWTVKARKSKLLSGVDIIINFSEVNVL